MPSAWEDLVLILPLSCCGVFLFNVFDLGMATYVSLEALLSATQFLRQC